MSRYIENVPEVLGADGKPVNRFFCSCDLCGYKVPVRSHTVDDAITVAKRLKWDVKEVEIIGQGKTPVCVCPTCRRL